MRAGATIAVIIPVLNEEASIGQVIEAVPRWVDDIVVVDNGCTDGSAAVARAAGARVVREGRRGYGAACLAGIAALAAPDIVVFLDGDFSEYPDEMALLVDPIADGRADLVIGSRIAGHCERGALTPQARFGNGLSCALLRLFWRVSYTDLGPFRAIRREALRRIEMRDRDYGWTVEMQVKAVIHGLRGIEVPVSYRRRIGKSKISGTVRGVLGAGAKILYTLFHSAAVHHLAGRRGVRERVVVFTRWPEPGRTKTRMIPTLGGEGAAGLQRAMTALVLARARALRRRVACDSRRPVSVEVLYTGGDGESMRGAFGADVVYRPQPAGDLGERMNRTFVAAFGEGMARAVIIGSDCPGVTPELLGEALDRLQSRDLVLGPATDGGYYLIGLRRPARALFEGMPWGDDTVLARTLAAARQHGLSTTLLPTLSDVDRPEDLGVWETAAGAERGERISVIIPALNESARLGQTLGALAGADVEVIVVDGASNDGTSDLAAGHGVRVLHVSGGRAAQMNRGAAEATGEILVFLHADTLLPPGFDLAVRRVLRSGAVAGAFEFGVSSADPRLRLIERLANWRSRRLGRPYGDQAIFLRAETFRRLGGFPEVPIMEDLLLVRHLGREGRIGIVARPVRTSARRWRALGVWRTMLLNQKVLAGRRLGVPIETLAKWYRAPLRVTSPGA